ncbi:peroxisomal membrane protein 11B [Neodiprion pinetum]|uniref:peroxisomal membrane protein 11B n=1 Tax=Neodiprion pinetum TaxID=441929 RepID=UPI001EE02EF0|nr:peroxisomal membrane protein 11B [Neodiprion pinetum]
MDVIVKLNNQTAGRDKIIRLLQYGSRASWYFVQHGERTRQRIDILKSLEYTFSSFRKLLRLGRCLDLLYSALSSMRYPDLVVRITMTLSKISNALFLLADHIIWVGRAGICQVNVEKWNQVSNKYWLMAIVMNLVRDVYEISKIMEQETAGLKSRAVRTCKFDLPVQFRALCCVKNHTDVFVDTIKNSCDIFIPLTSLGYTRFNPGVVGLLGLISSAAGIYSLVYPLAKLTPA